MKHRLLKALKQAVEPKAHLTGISRFSGGDYLRYIQILAMVEMANDESLEPSMRLDCHKTVANCIHPKLWSVEVLQSQEQQPITIEIVQPH